MNRTLKSECIVFSYSSLCKLLIFDDEIYYLNSCKMISRLISTQTLFLLGKKKQLFFTFQSWVISLLLLFALS